MNITVEMMNGIYWVVIAVLLWLMRKQSKANSHESFRKERLFRLLESIETSTLPDNVSSIFNGRTTQTFTHADAIGLHQSVICAVASWDEFNISELRQFAVGTRAGWLQSGLISRKEFHSMINEIDQAVILRLSALAKDANNDK